MPTQAQLLSEILANLPSTGTHAITADRLRTTLNEIVTAIFQGNILQIFDTRSNAAVSIVPGSINVIRINGYSTFGDGGGALYRRSGSVPIHGASFQSADGTWWELAERGDLDVMMFGIVGDNVSDNWPALKRMRDYMRAYPRSWRITFGPGTYLYSKNYWAKGINDLTINAYGATFHCNSTDPFDFNKADFVGNGGTFEPWGYENYATATNFGSLIQSATAGSEAVTCLTVSQAGGYSVGSKVLIWGFGTQNGGFPPNPRYFEWNKVVSANPGTGLITLAYPLRNSYDQNWHTYAADGTGAPYITNLSRIDFTQCERLVINGGYFGTGALTSSSLCMLLTGYDYVELNEVGLDNFVPSICGRVVLNNCILRNGEPDKIVRSLEIVGGQIQNVQAYTGVEEVVLRGGVVVLGNCTFYPHRLIVDGAHFSNNNAAGAAVIRISGGWASVGVDIRQARFTIWDVSLSALIETGADTSFTVSSVTSNTKVLVSCANDTAFETIYQQLRIGFTYQLLNGSKRVRIKKIYDADASHVAIEGQWTAVPVGGEVYHGSTIQHINIGDIVQDGLFAPLPVALNFGYNQQYQRIDARDRNSETLLISWQDLIQPASGGNNQFLNISIRGWIRRVVINVSKVYSGPDGTCFLHMTTPGFVDYIDVDAKTLGIREITAWGSQGAVGADTLRPTSFGGVYLDQISLYVSGAGQYPTYSDPVQLPKFTIHIETQKES